MSGMAGQGFEQRFQPSRAILAGCGEASLGVASLEDRLEQAIPIKEELDRVRSWGKGLSPKLARALSAGRLLFQLVGVAGYAGYFVSMHTFMRLFSGALVAGTWYLIYRVKGTHQL